MEDQAVLELEGLGSGWAEAQHTKPAPSLLLSL